MIKIRLTQEQIAEIEGKNPDEQRDRLETIIIDQLVQDLDDSGFGALMSGWEVELDDEGGQHMTQPPAGFAAVQLAAGERWAKHDPDALKSWLTANAWSTDWAGIQWDQLKPEIQHRYAMDSQP